MTEEEQRRAVVLTAIYEGRLTVPQAATLLGLSHRHCQRLLAAFRREGPAALAHGNRGRIPRNRLPKALEQRISRLARTVYRGFNHQHLTEQLAEDHGIVLSRPTVHRLLVAAGIPSPRTRRAPRHRRRRERMPQAGLLVQFDASHHDWLEGRGPRLALHGALDDATSQVPAATFHAQEDAHGYFLILRTLVSTCGVPVAFYSDQHGIFHRSSHRPPSLDAQLRGEGAPSTQVGRALRELGIRWIPASSPQAKGRIERLWGTFQDRLVSELRRARARTLEQANAVLATFLPRYNARFTHPPANPTSAYRPLPPGADLNDICCFKYERTVANDNTVQVGALRLQVLPGPQRRSYAKARVVIHEHLDGTVSVHHQGDRLASSRLAAPSLPTTPGVLRARGPARLGRSPTPARASQTPRRRSGARPSTRPAPDHPWRRSAQEAMRRKLLKQAGVTFSHFT